jgi:hypothetical protein
MATGWHNPTHLVLSVDFRDRLRRRDCLEQAAMATGWHNLTHLVLGVDVREATGWHNPTHLVLSVDFIDRLGGRKIWNKRRWRQGGIIRLTWFSV